MRKTIISIIVTVLLGSIFMAACTSRTPADARPTPTAVARLALDSDGNIVVGEESEQEAAQAPTEETASEVADKSTSETPTDTPEATATIASEGVTTEEPTVDIQPSEPTEEQATVTESPTAIEETLTPTPEATATAEPTVAPTETAEATATNEPTAAPAATATETPTDEPEASAQTTTPMMGQMGMGPGQGGGMGPGNNMRTFHSVPIPTEYSGMVSPIEADADSLARGQQSYNLLCATCHGETGLGDGPAGAALDPAPPSIAMTSQMLGDDYLFWRISEGGAFDPFNSAMPTWKAALSEEQRWDIINYVRSMGRDMPGMMGMSDGTAATDANADAEQAMRAEMLAAGIEQGLISEDEATVFDTVHEEINQLLAADPNRQFTGTMRDLQDQLLEELVADGTVTAEDAEIYNNVHLILEQSDLMP